MLPTFNNSLFTDQELVSQTNNDPVKTPSTVDPVSTVTGNNYHDETDITIRGRGLNYALTRTYNSAPASTKINGPFGYGWTHAYNMKLRSNDYGDCPNCVAGLGAGKSPVNGNSKTSSITYTDERGGEHRRDLGLDDIEVAQRRARRRDRGLTLTARVQVSTGRPVSRR